MLLVGVLFLLVASLNGRIIEQRKTVKSLEQEFVPCIILDNDNSTVLEERTCPDGMICTKGPVSWPTESKDKAWFCEPLNHNKKNLQEELASHVAAIMTAEACLIEDIQGNLIYNDSSRCVIPGTRCETGPIPVQLDGVFHYIYLCDEEEKQEQKLNHQKGKKHQGFKRKHHNKHLANVKKISSITSIPSINNQDNQPANPELLPSKIVINGRKRNGNNLFSRIQRWKNNHSSHKKYKSAHKQSHGGYKRTGNRSSRPLIKNNNIRKAIDAKRGSRNYQPLKNDVQISKPVDLQILKDQIKKPYYKRWVDRENKPRGPKGLSSYEYGLNVNNVSGRIPKGHHYRSRQRRSVDEPKHILEVHHRVRKIIQRIERVSATFIEHAQMGGFRIN